MFMGFAQKFDLERLEDQLRCLRQELYGNEQDDHGRFGFIEKQIAELAVEIRKLNESLLQIWEYLNHPRLTKIKIFFEGEDSMATVGPVTLTAVGEVRQARVLGFDQNGNPMPADFTLPTISWSNDDTAGAIATFAADPDGVHENATAVANGTVNLTASVTSAEGLALSDVEQVIVNIPTPPPPPTPVLSSIKIAWEDVPAPTV